MTFKKSSFPLLSIVLLFKGLRIVNASVRSSSQNDKSVHLDLILIQKVIFRSTVHLQLERVSFSILVRLLQPQLLNYVMLRDLPVGFIALDPPQ